MKNIKIAASVLLVFVMCSAFTMKAGKKGVYMVGVSASFTDSLVYFTEIQLVDSVMLDKDGLLPQRQQYSYQLKTYLENKYGAPHRTCFIYFDKNKEKLEKSIQKMRGNYTKGGKSIIRQVGPDFKFTKAVEY